VKLDLESLKAFHRSVFAQKDPSQTHNILGRITADSEQLLAEADDIKGITPMWMHQTAPPDIREEGMAGKYAIKPKAEGGFTT